MRPRTIAASTACAAWLWASGAFGGLTIDVNYESGTWTEAMKVVVEDAASEWEAIFCRPITIFIDFTWHEFQGEYATAWGLSQDFVEDQSLHLPFSADVELNTLLVNDYYWDPTPWDTTDDAGQFGANAIDAASVLKHEIAHAIGFTSNYSKWDAMVEGGKDLDGDGDARESWLDFNGNGEFDLGETVLADGDDSHIDDAYYHPGESPLMGYPGFGRGEQARPSMIEIFALHEVYDYPIHIPEPSTCVIWFLLAALGLCFGRYPRRRAA